MFDVCGPTFACVDIALLVGWAVLVLLDWILRWAYWFGWEWAIGAIGLDWVFTKSGLGAGSRSIAVAQLQGAAARAPSSPAVLAGRILL